MTSIKWRTLATDLVRKRTQMSTESSFNQNSLKKVRINESIRLSPFDKFRNEALKWYQDPENMRNIVGIETIYSKEQVKQMYHWQNEHGFLYYIEYRDGDCFQTIGDVWLAEDDYAIVIDQAFQNRHIGRMVTKYFIYKAKKLGRERITVSEIFNWNEASQKMFTHLNFYPYKKQKDSWSYRKRLKNQHLRKKNSI
ncbi:GNAT family N-acetyltransferase [Enterococcus sp. S22(2020)]|nr:GNAT family N-acetyltransferase [Enterococcus sp. S23]MCA5016182.1 GNAT family N-acetyltransferase [Enterococcus sp. S22(2020)]